ncbi:MAG: GAF domain-containing sensor histidine kinase [Acidobacteriota bacterium]|nr:GAF domain-containing sensor histidine kinase [Acidobacteriota bacterium]
MMQMDWVTTPAVTAAVLAAAVLGRRWVSRHTCFSDARIRQELEAYGSFEPRLAAGDDMGTLAVRICRLIRERSAYQRVAMIAQDGDGRLYLAANEGVEPIWQQALQEWCSRIVVLRGERNDLPGRELMLAGVPRVSFRLNDPAFVRTQAVVALPLWTSGYRLLGALVVLERQLPWCEASLRALTMLAAKLARSMENAALAERLLRSEKLASLGQLAGGVAHALNNPLTAVLGYAELIAETSAEQRVQEDAGTIVREAMRMQGTVQRLIDFWRPVPCVQEPVSLGRLFEDLAAVCRAPLAGRGIRLVVEVSNGVPPVRGCRDRLRHVLEHLLNNASQALAGAEPGPESGGPMIRMALTCDARSVQMIISDTGPGFSEPTRIFDPFYTTRKVGEGEGLGLNICYGIVREHGGEINAFNLHPHGAAVVVELPIRPVAKEEAMASDPLLPEPPDQLAATYLH